MSSDLSSRAAALKNIEPAKADRMTDEPTKPTRKPPPQQARARAKRAMILDAAEALLIDIPPDAITTRAVAEAAGIPVGSVYRYFENAADLLLSVFDRMNAATLERLSKSLAIAEQKNGPTEELENGTGPEDWRVRLDAVFARLLTMHVQHKSYGALMRFADRHGRGNDDVANILLALMARDAPDIPPSQATLVVQTLLALIDGIERQLSGRSEADIARRLAEGQKAIERYLSSYLP